MSEMMMISVPLDDYEEKAKDQRTLEIMRDMLGKKRHDLHGDTAYVAGGC